MDAVDLDEEWAGQANVTDEFGLIDGWQLIELLFAPDAIATEGVDSEVRDAERGEVLEEVGALRRIDLEIVQSRLDYNPGSRDVRPLDGDAKPRVARAPATRTDVDAVAAFVEELTVDVLDLLGDGGVVASGVGGLVARRRTVGNGGCFWCQGLDVDDVLDVVHDAITDG